MENYSHQSYPDSGDSSPLSRDIDCENPHSWDDSAAGAPHKVKFMCSYGGKIQPRPHDNQLSYVGGDTKILSLDRASKFPAILAKLASLCDAAPNCVSFKYQLPGEDLDALISVTNDEDLEHMMMEYDRVNRSSPKPARLRIFLFPLNQKPSSEEAKSEGNWFVDTINSAQCRPVDVPPPAPAISEPANPDFLFGFDKRMNKAGDQKPNSGNIPDLNDKVTHGEPVASIQSQIERFRIGDGEIQKPYQDQNPNENTSRVYPSEFKAQEKAVPLSMATTYWPERQVAAGNCTLSGGIPLDQQPVYVIQNPPGMYHQNPSVRPATGLPPVQGYYGVSRMMPEVYRDQMVYSTVGTPPPSSMMQQAKITAMQEGIGLLRQPAPGIVTEQGYTQVSYVDSAGRPVYYTAPGGGLAPRQPFQMFTTAVDGRSVGGAGPDSVVVGGKEAQPSTV